MLHKANRQPGLWISPSIGRVITLLLPLTGCSGSALEPAIRHVPTVITPKPPVAAMFGRPDENGRWLRLRDIKFTAGKVFGWRIHLPCRQPVEFTEIMKLPAPGDWTFSPDDLRETTISGAGKIATTHDFATCTDGWIEHSWTISPKDPTGEWEISVAVPSYQTQVWRVRFVK